MDNWYRINPDWRTEPSITPLSETVDWSQLLAGLPDIWKENRGRGVKMGVIDTMVDANHSDFRGAIQVLEDYTNDRGGQMHPHGTWCASMLGARADGNGVVGVMPECELYCYAGLNSSGSGSESVLLKCMERALYHGVNLLSLSFGGPRMSPQFHALLRECVEAGMFPFAATGNDAGRVNDPALSPWTIGVGASDKNGRLTDFSSRGPELDIVAPGVDMIGAAPGGGYQSMTGTSMATPFAAGVGGLIFAKHRDMGGNTPLSTLEDMRRHLQITGTRIDGGWTLISPRNAIDALIPAKPEEPELVDSRPVAISMEWHDGTTTRYARG